MKSFWKSLRCALSGLVYVFRRERNFQIELVIALGVLAGSFSWPLTTMERVVLCVVIGWVLVLEMLNTAFERLLDMLKPHVHPYVRVTKDLMAGAVLLSAGFAVLIGLLVFFPYWLS